MFSLYQFLIGFLVSSRSICLCVTIIIEHYWKRSNKHVANGLKIVIITRNVSLIEA